MHVGAFDVALTSNCEFF